MCSGIFWPLNAACHLDAQIIAASSGKAETSVQTVCLHEKVAILVVCELPAATWSWSIRGSSRRCTGQRETRCNSKSLLEIRFYPAGNQLMARSTSSTMKFKRKHGYLHFGGCSLRTRARSTQIGVFPEQGGVCARGDGLTRESRSGCSSVAHCST